MPLALTLYPNLPMPFMDTERFPAWFSNYSQVLFDNFGDRVKHWFTFNEPFCFSVFGVTGNKDPYTIAHSSLLAHATAVQLYRKRYQAAQGGTIGIVLNTMHFYPADPNNPVDVAQAQRGYGMCMLVQRGL